jgi:glutaredoxin-related protein
MSDEEIARHLMNMPALQAFSPNCATSTVTVDTLCKYIEFKWSDIMNNSTLHEVLKKFPNLETLAVTVPEQMDQLHFADIVGQFKKLRKLGFTDSHLPTIADRVLRAIADGCPSLQCLDIGFSEY